MLFLFPESVNCFFKVVVESKAVLYDLCPQFVSDTHWPNICERHPRTQHLWATPTDPTFVSDTHWPNICERHPLTQHLWATPPTDPTFVSDTHWPNICERQFCRSGGSVLFADKDGPLENWSQNKSLLIEIHPQNGTNCRAGSPIYSNCIRIMELSVYLKITNQKNWNILLLLLLLYGILL